MAALVVKAVTMAAAARAAGRVVATEGMAAMAAWAAWVVEEVAEEVTRIRTGHRSYLHS